MTRDQQLMITGMDLLSKKFICMPDDTQVTVSKIIEVSNEIYDEIKGNNEFCEWTEYDYETIRSPHDRDFSIPSMKDFKFCPYCGKEIKVIRKN